MNGPTWTWKWYAYLLLILNLSTKIHWNPVISCCEITQKWSLLYIHNVLPIRGNTSELKGLNNMCNLSVLKLSTNFHWNLVISYWETPWKWISDVRKDNIKTLSLWPILKLVGDNYVNKSSKWETLLNSHISQDSHKISFFQSHYKYS